MVFLKKNSFLSSLILLLNSFSGIPYVMIKSLYSLPAAVLPLSFVVQQVSINLVKRSVIIRIYSYPPLQVSKCEMSAPMSSSHAGEVMVYISAS